MTDEPKLTDMQREWMELVTKKEPLHPDLEPWLIEDGPMGLYLNSPLVQELTVNRECCALINRRYTVKLAERQRSRDGAEWERYIFLHERPYRVEALCDLLHDDVLSDQQYWDLVGRVYQDSENIWQNQKTWKGLLNKRRPEKHFLMDEDERRRLAGVPDVARVYRGIKNNKNRRGLSWTLDLTKAMFFARRHLHHAKDTGTILFGEVKRKDIHALLLGRNEFEVVADKVKFLRAEEAPKVSAEILRKEQG